MPLLVAGKWGQGHPYSVQIQSKTDLTLDFQDLIVNSPL